MSRIDVFDEVYGGHVFANLLNRDADEMLRARWDSLDEDARKALITKMNPRLEQDDEQALSNVRKVTEFYAYRALDEGLRQLPLMMQRVLLLGEDSDMSDVLYLATLGSISCCLPHYHGTLLGETVEPNLYILMTGAAATGKGRAGLCHKLIEPLDRKSPMFIAGNSSATAIYEALKDNGGRGLIFETELDTLTQAFRLGGDFSEGLRKAFHNEKISYQRRTKHEKVNILHPVLSMVLTGTPKQLPKMMKSAENGLFSRFLYYCLGGRRESFVESEDAMTITGDMITDYMHAIGKGVMNLYEKLSVHAGVNFSLTKEQHRYFMDHFHGMSGTYAQLSERAYGTDDASNDMEAMVRRMGNICYRIMMIQTMMRYADAEEIPAEITCNQDDFNNVLVMSEMLMHHSMVHYDEMLQATGVVGDGEDEPDLESSDLMNARQRNCWQSLPNKFIKRDAIEVGKTLDIPVKTLERYMRQFCELGILVKTGRANYEKICSEQKMNLIDKEISESPEIGS